MTVELEGGKGCASARVARGCRKIPNERETKVVPQGDRDSWRRIAANQNWLAALVRSIVGSVGLG